MAAQVEGDGEHRLVGDGRAADGLAAGAGRLVAFQGAVADALALHPRQRGQDGEHDPGRVVRALQLACEELQADTSGAQLLGERRELDAAAEPLVLMHDDRDRRPGRPDLSGQGDGLVELGPGDRAGGDLLGEDPGDARRAQRVGLGVERLADGRRAGVPDPHVPSRRGAGRRGAGQLGPGRAGTADRRDRDAECLRQSGYEPEPGGVVLDGHLPPAGPARRPGPGGAGGHRAVVRLNAHEVVVDHPKIVHAGVSLVHPDATTHETRFALLGHVPPWCFTSALAYEQLRIPLSLVLPAGRAAQAARFSSTLPPGPGWQGGKVGVCFARRPLVTCRLSRWLPSSRGCRVQAAGSGWRSRI